MKAISVKNRPASRLMPGVDLNHLRSFSSEQNTPFMLLRKSVIIDRYARLKQALKGIEIHYAVKANDHPEILKTLVKAGSAFDVSSARELQAVIECGGSPEKSVHSNPIKGRHEFNRAVALGARIFVADNADELDKFAAYDQRVGVLLRFRTPEGGSVVNLSYKFGAATEDIPDLLKKIKNLKIPFKGFCFHVGSQCTDTGKYAESISIAGKLIRLAGEMGLKTEILDIGGGFPIKYTSDVPDINKIGRAVRSALRREVVPSVRIICEPGRYLCGDAMTLFSSVIGRAQREGVKWYYLDDGIYGSFSGCLFDHCSYRIMTSRNTKWEKAVLAGPTCDSFDVIYRDCLMPPLDIGDVLMFPAMGAYTRVSATDFNGLNRARVVAVDW